MHDLRMKLHAEEPSSEITERGVKLKAQHETRLTESRAVELNRKKVDNEISRLNGLIAALDDERQRHATEALKLQEQLKLIEN